MEVSVPCHSCIVIKMPERKRSRSGALLATVLVVGAAAAATLAISPDAAPGPVVAPPVAPANDTNLAGNVSVSDARRLAARQRNSAKPLGPVPVGPRTNSTNLNSITQADR